MVITWLHKSIRYYISRHLILACAVALSAAIFCAALMTGHSLHEGLRKNLSKRIGPLQHALYFPERSIRASLAKTNTAIEAALLIQGELLDSQGNVCATKAQIIGIAPRAGIPPLSHPVLNERARSMLQGMEASLRFKKPTGLSVELPLGDTQSSRIIRRAIQIPATSPGLPEGLTRIPLDFAREPSTLPPVNIFVPYALLEEVLDLAGQANLFVSTGDPLNLPLSCEDFGLTLNSSTGTTLTSKYIYLPQKVTTLFPSNATPQTASFYLADSFEAQERQTPYGFVGAVTPSFCGTPHDLKSDEVVINAWLANQLTLEPQQKITLKWRRFETNGRLIPEERTFHIRAIIPTEEAAACKAFMPTFPGMKDVDSCAAWDVGMPMDKEKLNDKENEAYWKAWRETPKLLMSASAGEECFGAILGKAMSIRLQETPEKVRHLVETNLRAEDAGAVMMNLARDGARAAQGSTDFNGLFIGMLFILIISSLLLASLTFSLTLDSRKRELALLLATGWSRQRCLMTYFLEWMPTLLIASILGVILGCGVTHFLIWSLSRFWRAAFAEASLTYAFSLNVALISILSLMAIMGTILFLHLRRLTRQSPTTLWQVADERMTPLSRPSKVSPHLLNIFGTLLALLALLILLLTARGEHAHGAFFGAGFFLLLSLVLFIRSSATLWRASLTDKSGPILTGLCRAAHLPRRNTPVVLLIALGTFLVIGVLSMKQDPAANTANPSSGSGGFESMVSSIIPFEREKGMEMAKRISGAKVVIPIRVHEGDNAGCLNMNAPVSPTVYGLDAQALARLRAFEPPNAGGVWSPLSLTLTNGCLPALAADLSMLQYSLKANANPNHGTLYRYGDASVQLVGVLPVRNTILQGALLMDEQAFLKAFPNEQGYRLWLCDYAPYLLRELTSAPTQLAKSNQKLMAVQHPEPGISIETTEQRLRLLASVESTYLDMFLVFGGLGLMLGLFGIALIIIRGVEERKHEFALLGALGLSRKHVFFLLFSEYGALIASGLFSGLLPALIAIQPAATALKSEMPWLTLLGVIASLILSAMLCIVGSAFLVTRSLSLDALKNE
jgi:ABC-type lipoprotein release transport system permease subunit